MPKPELVYVTEIRTTPEQLWQALTDPEFTQRYWYGTRIESTFAVGAPLKMVKQGGAAPDTGVILVADKPRTLSFSWHIAWGDMAKERDSRATFTIEPLPGGMVKLTVTHDDLEEGGAVMQAMQNGWKGILAGLKTMLEGE